MSVNLFEFLPADPLVKGSAESACRAIVIIPARNEQDSLAASLDALKAQVDLREKPLPTGLFEIILLLNNCTDRSAEIAAQWQKNHPEVQLHIIERTFPSDQAFVGTARKLLMDTAWRRLEHCRNVCAILSTDSDTIVSPNWVALNLAAIEAGADAVGGVIALKPGECQSLPSKVRRAYLLDRRYQQLVAELEDRLDPQPGDPWPRHLEHFGASLACTRQIYQRAGGMPAVTPLEDVAFVDRLRRVGATLRHHPHVVVYTSSRLDGRVEVGLSGQFRIWQTMDEQKSEHLVLSADWLVHRFCILADLRKEAQRKAIPVADYLIQMNCDRLISDEFRGAREGEINHVNRCLADILVRLPTPAHP